MFDDCKEIQNISTACSCCGEIVIIVDSTLRETIKCPFCDMRFDFENEIVQQWREEVEEDYCDILEKSKKKLDVSKKSVSAYGGPCGILTEINEMKVSHILENEREVKEMMFNEKLRNWKDERCLYRDTGAEDAMFIDS